MLDPDRRHLIAYVAAAAVLVVMAVRLLGGDRGAPQAPISVAAPARATAPTSDRATAAPRQAPIWVDVAGAVLRPGLYALPKGARIAAAIQRAGGVRPRADRAAVNLAARLNDGQQVFVPARTPGASPGSGAAAAGSTTGSGGAGASGVATSGTASAPISLSSATQTELEQLDGIGPALAMRIMEYRDQNGGFRSIDQLREVSGIGDKRFEALKGSIAP